MNTDKANKYTSEEVEQIIDSHLRAQKCDEYADTVDIERILTDENYEEIIDKALYNHWVSMTDFEQRLEVLAEVKHQFASNNKIECAPKVGFRRVVAYVVWTAAVVAIVVGGYFFYPQNRVSVTNQVADMPIVETLEKPIMVEILDPELIAELPQKPAKQIESIAQETPQESKQESEPTKIEEIRVDPQKSIVEHTTAQGEEMHLSLADGSKVILSGGSTLRYKEDFEGASRYVMLSGKAYFEVARDESKLFKVEANDIAITVLGTKFGVNSYSGESHSRIKLDSGNITVTTPNGMEFLMHPGEELIYNHTTSSADIKREKKTMPLKRSKQKNKK